MFTPYQIDKIRNLRYSIKAINLIEKKMKVSFYKIDYENLTVEELCIILWAGLFHEDNLLTPEIVMELIDQHSSIKKATQAMNDAFSADFGDAGK